MQYDTSLEYYTICAYLKNFYFDKGKVLLAKHKKSSSLVAIKHYNLEDLSQKQYEMVCSDVWYMKQFQHPCIITCSTAFIVNSDLLIVSPFMNFMSCHDLIITQFRNGLPELVICLFLRDILHALEYIHNHGYIHRAIKARHILVNLDGRACLSGMRHMYPMANANNKNSRVSHKVFNFPIDARHNLNWLSPEILMQNAQGYDEKSDIYSLGVTACELANGIVPFAEFSTTFMLTEKVCGVTPQLIDRSTIYMYETEENTCNLSNSKKNLHDSEENYDDEDHKYDSIEKTTTIPDYDVKCTREFSDPFHAFVHLCCGSDSSVRPSSSQLLHQCSFFKQIRKMSNVNIAELLKPAVPFTTDNTAELNEELANVENLSDRFTDINVQRVEWNF